MLPDFQPTISSYRVAHTNGFICWGQRCYQGQIRIRRAAAQGWSCSRDPLQGAEIRVVLGRAAQAGSGERPHGAGQALRRDSRVPCAQELHPGHTEGRAQAG